MGLLLLPAFDTNINTTIRAQKIITTDDDDVCGCSPPTYTFVLDFSLSCPPVNITTDTGSGVASASCLISPFGAPTNKLAPVVVDSVSILELDQINSVLVEERIDGELFDGDSFSYSSIINNPDDITGIRQIPKALQLNLNGKNEDGIMLMNVFIVTFSNECGVFPVIQEGESAGWAIFVSLYLLRRPKARGMQYFFVFIKKSFHPRTKVCYSLDYSFTFFHLLIVSHSYVF